MPNSLKEFEGQYWPSDAAFGNGFIQKNKKFSIYVNVRVILGADPGGFGELWC